MSRLVVSLSGGMDSATLLGVLHATDYDSSDLIAIAFRYGSKHNEYELKSAKELAAYYDVEYHCIDLTSVTNMLKSDLLKSGGAVPEGHYAAETMTKTVVPGRNLIFISVLTGCAWSVGAEKVAVGIHAGDHAIYPDCRPPFYYAMRTAVFEGTDGKVILQAPFLEKVKAEILVKGLALKVPYHLTRTCYKDQEVSCGRCGSCQERLEAFRLLGKRDPLQYEFRHSLLED